MDARHNSKSCSSSSSKHDSPSPTRENGPEEKPTKRIVSKIRSDVSAFRNAFRKSRAMTRCGKSDVQIVWSIMKESYSVCEDLIRLFQACINEGSSKHRKQICIVFIGVRLREVQF
jgi:hypothetical protein